MDITNRSQFNILIQLAEADKHFAESERTMIFNIARDRNFSEEEIRSLIRNPEPIDIMANLSDDQKFDYLNMCIQLICADHKIFEKELVFAETVASKLGFKKGVVEYLMQNLETKNQEELKLEISGKYL